MASTPQQPQKGIIGWLDYRLPVFTAARHSLVDYPTPRNLNYWWNFGSIAGICLVIQILTGVFLVMHYTTNTMHAFDSVEHIMRDVNYGWLLRYIHAVGASMFFTVVYIHIFRGLYYGSYKAPREVLWWLGLVILLLMMATAFMGYVLPWGQMSFWGATVITNLFSAFPLIGESIVNWLWGGFSVDNPTLNRFFALHYLLPFLIVGVVVLHLAALHTHGSNNPLGIDAKGPKDKIPFHPYYTSKDFFGFGVFFLVFAYFVFFAPNYLGHPDNYTEANPMVTPAHIVPEWYFLPFYAILRAITFNTPLWLVGIAAIAGGGFFYARHQFNRTHTVSSRMQWGGLMGLGALLVLVGFGLGWSIEAKLGGVLAMFASILLHFFLPWLDSSPVRSGNFRPMFRIAFWIMVVDCILLGYAGSQPADWGIVIGFCSGDAECTQKTTQVLMLIEVSESLKSSLIDITVSLLASAYYFFHFLILLPWIARVEKPLPLPKSISQPVLQA